MKLLNDVLKTITRYDMVRRGNRVLVAVSGGPDSVSLLYALRNLREKLGIDLCVAHLDHGIRGKESKKDARFVKKLAASFGIKCAQKELKLKNLKSKLSLEEILREKRYEFFKAAAAKFKASVVATAHTLDDQAETVLMRIIKGASLKGLVGIHPVRLDGKIKFIRPLIEIEKKELISYLKEKKIHYRVDRTNMENRFLRNEVRNRILPYLSKINPRVKRALFNLAETLKEDFEFIEEEKKKRSHIVRGKGGIKRILLCDIIFQPKALQKELVREALKSAGANIKKLTFRHWKDIDYFIKRLPKGKSLSLPGRVRIEKSADSLLFKR